MTILLGGWREFLIVCAIVTVVNGGMRVINAYNNTPAYIIIHGLPKQIP